MFRHVIWAFSTGSEGESGLSSCCEGILGVPLEPAQGNWDLSQADGKQDVLFHCSRIRGVPLEIQLVRQASSCGVRGSWDSSGDETGNGPSSPDEVGTTGFPSSFGGKLGFYLEG